MKESGVFPSALVLAMNIIVPMYSSEGSFRLSSTDWGRFPSAISCKRHRRSTPNSTECIKYTLLDPKLYPRKIQLRVDLCTVSSAKLREDLF